jgi:DNA-binding XRE family transcriptional regulator
MAAYRIKTLGSRIVVGTEDEAVLICKNLDVARQAVADAENAQPTPTWRLLAQRAGELAEKAEALHQDEVPPDADDGDDPSSK